MQELAAEAEYCPVVHNTQPDALVAPEEDAVPASQLKQLVEPRLYWYLPAAQLVQSDDKPVDDEYEPAAHPLHPDDPELACFVPAGHTKHAVEPITDA